MSEENRVGGEIYLTDQDYQRLTGLLARTENEVSEFLEEEVERAHIFPQDKIPADVVTMNSRVRCSDLDSGEVSELTLVYPQDADIEQGRVSVLAPMGAALIGLRRGQSIEWQLPTSGRKRRLKVTAVLYQPEAAGDWHL